MGRSFAQGSDDRNRPSVTPVGDFGGRLVLARDAVARDASPGYPKHLPHARPTQFSEQVSESGCGLHRTALATSVPLVIVPRAGRLRRPT